MEWQELGGGWGDTPSFLCNQGEHKGGRFWNTLLIIKQQIETQHLQDTWQGQWMGTRDGDSGRESLLEVTELCPYPARRWPFTLGGGLRSRNLYNIFQLSFLQPTVYLVLNHFISKMSWLIKLRSRTYDFIPRDEGKKGTTKHPTSSCHFSKNKKLSHSLDSCFLCKQNWNCLVLSAGGTWNVSLINFF